MPDRHVFIRPTTLFSVFRESAGEEVRVIFRRYTTSGHEAGMHLTDLGADAVERYLTGGYEKIYLSLDKVPVSPQDWEFLDRALDELVTIQGCRMRDNLLEICHLRPAARVSRAQSLFNRIDRRIKKRCKRGLISEGGREYSHIWFEPEVAKMELRQNLDQPESVYRRASGPTPPPLSGTLSRPRK